MTAPRRPVLRYHGGKFRLAPWIVSQFPPHKAYCEPFAGAASVLLHKPRVAAECINDLDDRIVNVFRVLRDPLTAEELRRRIELTPFSRTEFNAAFAEPTDIIDGAYKSIVLAFMGHSSDSVTRGCRTGFRCKMSSNRAFAAQDWANWPDQVPIFVERLQGVAIENRNALEVIARLDAPKTLFYVDPPYPRSTRSDSAHKHAYRHEMTDDEHRVLATLLHGLKGMVVLSSYASELYDKELYADWRREKYETLADGARPRTEFVYLNQACTDAQRQQRLIA